MNRLCLALITTFVTSLVVSSFAAPPVVVEWRNDRTGIFNETGLLKEWHQDGPELMWYYEQLGAGHSSVAISNNKLYVAGMVDGKGYLHVFDADGNKLNKIMYGNEWNTNYDGTRGTPNFSAGKIYLITGVGDVICLDEETLDVVWKRNMLVDFNSKNITWGITESPLIIEEKLIVTPGGQEHNVVALNKNTGEVIWSSQGLGELSAYCSPLYIHDQKTPLIVTITAHHILGLEAATGKLLWSFENRNTNHIHSNTPLYANNMILIASVDKGATMIKLSDGGLKAEIVWQIPELDNMMGALVKIDDHVYGSSSGYKNRNWFCVDWNSGEIKFLERGFGMGVTIYADGMLYCYSDRGEMALVKPAVDKFNIVSKFTIEKGTDQHWAHPVIYKGVLYVRRGDALMAYKIN